jgi:predicted ribosome quality control (RQC) complex YloA/Tae2 family protein
LEIKFRHYIIDDKYDVYVGKDSKNNDLLTFRFGKPNDYWFHARGVPGSHVILKNPGKAGVPKEIIKKTASIAAFYSKAKNGSFVPVAYTFRKFVLKKKGLEQGQVILQRESVVMAEPGIPAGCRNPDADEE